MARAAKVIDCQAAESWCPALPRVGLWFRISPDHVYDGPDSFDLGSPG